MTDDRAEKPGQRARIMFAAALVLVYLSMILTAYVYHRNPPLMRDAGLSELPWLSIQGIRFVEFVKAYWFILAPFFLFLSAFAAIGLLGRPNLGVIAAVFLIALAIPVFGYIALEKPLVELDRKSHPAEHHPFG